MDDLSHQEWFEAKMSEFKDDPEFLREKIELLDDEIKFLKKENESLRNKLNAYHCNHKFLPLYCHGEVLICKKCGITILPTD